MPADTRNLQYAGTNIEIVMTSKYYSMLMSDRKKIINDNLKNKQLYHHYLKLWNWLENIFTLSATDRRTEQQTAVFEITSVTRADEGQYICLAQNAAGAAEDRVQLLVEELDTLPTRGDIPGNL